MSRASSTRDAWRPQTRQDREAVLQEMHAVLASPHFCNSKRYPALLKYIVENTLDGKADLLKERTLGVEVFERPASYDTNADTVVRYTAGEVRKRLSLYYHELDRRHVVQISLPAGSYVPEFTHEDLEAEETGGSLTPAALSTADGTHWDGDPVQRTIQSGLHQTMLLPTSPGPLPLGLAKEQPSSWIGRRLPRWIAAALVIAVISGVAWKSRTTHPYTPMDDFWAPLLRNQRTVVLCSGVVVFNQSAFSGVTTAGKDAEYPFVSFQSASAINLLSDLIARNGATTQLQSSASIPLTALREQPVIYVGGYNNEWTLRLLDPLPFHFGPAADAAILDRDHPQVSWRRDCALPYSAEDDYSLIARFRDPTTGQWAIVVAGLGRNGSEAAADFVTSPQYMQQLRNRIGSDFADHNVEAVLKINVIEGKTGAPSIVGIHTW